ncbi:TetR-like C-terminal domain-containing protein [Williamsia muralis]|uniref:TetR-like C-terminal domain-containing protein n=1 Tax=Williamsia marianensis TaxID=85044 RepID=A0ABU4F0R1_WILMA|nr:TetR-like C-terminal domain-containing protein [Williamsia muralis]MDV7137094.1 TetR-like C-terminal domain-containing protein [Williamsia muralis]
MELMINRAIERGELTGGLDSTDVVAHVLGPVLYRAALQRLPVTAGFIAAVVHSAIDAHTPDPP